MRQHELFQCEFVKEFLRRSVHLAMDCSESRARSLVDGEIATRIQLNATLENRSIYKSLSGLFCESHKFKNSITEMVENSNTTNLRKKEQLHKKWLTNLYYPLRGNIRNLICNQRLECRRQWEVELCRHNLSKSGVFADNNDVKGDRCQWVRVQKMRLMDPLLSEEKRKLSEWRHLHDLHSVLEPCSYLRGRHTKHAPGTLPTLHCNMFASQI